MAKRVYWESLKQYAIKVGIPTGVAGFALLFIYLSAIGSIDITGYSGDVVCQGSEENPCFAYINFTAKEDIFLYPIGYDPYGRETPFFTDKSLKEWKMYRLWGTGWREIDLKSTCKGTWCGGKYGASKNAYSFAFRDGKDYEIKIEAQKEYTQNIKWGFGPVDPVWIGVNNTKLYDSKTKTMTIKNLNITVGTVKLNSDLEVFVIRGYRKVAEWEINNLDKIYPNAIQDIEFLDKRTNKTVTKQIDYKYLKVVGTEIVPTYEKQCFTETYNGLDGNICKRVQIGSQEVNKTEWVSFDEKADLPLGKVTIGLFTDVLPEESIEWVPTIMDITISEWAVWTEGLNVGLQRYYKFDEASGGTAVDSIGNQNLAVTSSHQGANGIISNSYNISAESLNSSYISLGEDELTINLWMNRSGTIANDCRFFIDLNFQGVDGNYLMTELEDDVIARAYFDGGTDALESSVLPLGLFSMITVTWDVPNSQLRLYENADNTLNLSIGNFDFLDRELFIGGEFGGGSQCTRIGYDELGIWNRSLTGSEVVDLYNDGDGITHDALLDTCTYTSGDWNIDASDNCVISDDVVIDGSDVFCTGSGTFTIQDTFQVSNYGRRQFDRACYYQSFGSGGFFQ